MTSLTAKALSDQEELFARESVDIVHSHAAKVVQEEQIQKYFSHRGISEGHDIMKGGGGRVGRLGGPVGTSGTGSSMGRDTTTTQRDSGVRDIDDDLLISLKMFVPRQAQNNPGYGSSGATPLERHLMLGDLNEPSYIRRPAMMQAQYYGDMSSIETRGRQARVSAENAINEGQSRRTYTQEGILGSTRDGFVNK